MKVAVIGCLHGELDIIYEKVQNYEQKNNVTVDLILVCGDFQTVRNQNDLQCMAVPPKFRRLGTFHQYYFEKKTAPKLTLLIGGNHEASNYLQTLPYGGWVAPNMYYLGYSSVIRYRGLRIGGISGIFKSHDAKYHHFECLPYDNSSMRSIYHMRELDIYKFLQLANKDNRKVVDVFMSHDWPINIHTCGNVNYLLKVKPFFRDEVNSGTLGNPLLQPLVHHLKPRHWFAAHLHVGFSATVFHNPPNNGPDGGQTEELKTEFQALDKIIPRRHFMQVVDIPHDESKADSLEYDPEWLVILRKTNHLMSSTRKHVQGIDIFNDINKIEINEEEINEIQKLYDGNLEIPKNFARCEPVVEEDKDDDQNRQRNYLNPQTTKFCETLNITDPNESFLSANQPIATKVENPDEINLDDSEDEECCEEFCKKQKTDDVLFFVDTKGEQQ